MLRRSGAIAEEGQSRWIPVTPLPPGLIRLLESQAFAASAMMAFSVAARSDHQRTGCRTRWGTRSPHALAT